MPNTATPSAVPVCRMVLFTPLASPDRCGPSAPTAVATTDVVSNPAPTPHATSTGTTAS